MKRTTSTMRLPEDLAATVEVVVRGPGVGVEAVTVEVARV
jgi:hypothetical protein